MTTAESTTQIEVVSDDQSARHAEAPASPVELSAEQFCAVINSLKGEKVSDGSDERRQPRSDIKASASIILLRDSSHPGALNILIRDLSQSGIGFLHERPMSLDEEFALVLPRSGDTPSIILCSVACWQPLAKSVYAVGARFLRILRDGGDPALPIVIDPTSQNFAPVFQRLRAKAS